VDTRAATVPDLVEAATAQRATGTAVVAGELQLTYGELDAEANRLAHHLLTLGVGSDVPVGIYLERSPRLAVGLLASLKAGGACLPLDPAYSGERLAFMLRDARVPVVLTSSALASRLPATGATVLRVDADSDEWANRSETAPARPVRADNLGYVIYTSGSTGRPKGVMLSHGGLVNHHRAVAALYQLGPGDRVLQFCSIGFDASIEEMFPTWAAGATVVFRPDDVPLLGRPWLEWLRAHRITVVNLPTAYWHAWSRDLEARGESVPEGIRLFVVGGEKALGPAYQTWRRVGGGRARWINVYGPTETTCMSTFYEPRPEDGLDDGFGDGRDPPIGRPLANTTVRVVDETLRPVSPGVPGELLIGGAGVARGYLRDQRLTAERFIPDPVGGSPGGRMYRTGDLVRELPSGDLEFVGRRDDQVKIRGFRVECAEVEAVLARHPGVASAAVVPRSEQAGERQLMAYTVGRAAAGPTPGELRRFLADRLPSYMVPAAVFVLDEFPLTANGKVDRDALPGLAAAAAPAPSAGRPRSRAEERVASIWARVLGVGVERVGVDDDFFELGGHSLLATQVMAHVREEFGTQTPLRAIFEAPTVAGFAARLHEEALAAAGAAPLVAHTRVPGETLPLSLAQEQMWALETSASPPGLYNITALHRFVGPVDERALREALAYLVDRHEVLRTGFGVESGRPHQRISEPRPVPLEVTDAASDLEAELQRLIAEQDAVPFDVARPPLVRAGLFLLGSSARLALTVDHLICDGNGISILMRELLEAYDAVASGRAPALAPLALQFGDFALWQRSHVTEDVLRRQLDWWARALEGMPLGPTVPFDRMPATLTRRIAARAVTVPPGARGPLEELARDTGSTVFVVVLAAVAALLGRSGGTADVVMSTTLSGRNRTELEDLVGMFSGFGRIRIDLSGDPPFDELVARAREYVLGMFENQDIPFLRVRRRLLPDFPSDPLEVAASLPTEFGYFHAREHDAELFFRGQLHPLSITLLDDGRQISGDLSYKLDFYHPETVDRLGDDLGRVLDAVGARPSLRLSELPVSPPARP
jgi:amino acid adenylation domain-containing protein